MLFRTFASFSCSALFVLMACTATEPACVDECPAGAFALSACAETDSECTTYAMCSGEGGVSCSTSCNAAPWPQCPSGTFNIGHTAAIYPGLSSRTVSGCGDIVAYCAPCETTEVCPSGEVSDYSVQRELAEHYDCEVGSGLGGFICVPLDECLTCGNFSIEVESCEPGEDCREKRCGDEFIACAAPPSCDDIDPCEGSTSPVLRSGAGECPEDAIHCVAPRCRGEGAYCETACHPEARAVDSVELCANENCGFVDDGDERIWCAGEPPSCAVAVLCDEGDMMIDRDVACSVDATCYYRSVCGQVIQCEASI